MLNKIAHLRAIPAAEQEVDGGITIELTPEISQTGAKVLASSATIFNPEEGTTETIHNVREVLVYEMACAGCANTWCTN